MCGTPRYCKILCKQQMLNGRASYCSDKQNEHSTVTRKENSERYCIVVSSPAHFSKTTHLQTPSYFFSYWNWITQETLVQQLHRTTTGKTIVRNLAMDFFFFLGAEMVFQWYNTTPNTKWELIAEFNPSPPLTNTRGGIEEAGICTSNADMMAHLNKLWAKNFSVLGIKIKFQVLKESHNSWIRLTLFPSAAIWGESP